MHPHIYRIALLCASRHGPGNRSKLSNTTVHMVHKSELLVNSKSPHLVLRLRISGGTPGGAVHPKNRHGDTEFAESKSVGTRTLELKWGERGPPFAPFRTERFERQTPKSGVSFGY